jgi:hypothetical protein
MRIVLSYEESENLDCEVIASLVEAALQSLVDSDKLKVVNIQDAPLPPEQIACSSSCPATGSA